MIIKNQCRTISHLSILILGVASSCCYKTDQCSNIHKNEKKIILDSSRSNFLFKFTSNLFCSSVNRNRDECLSENVQQHSYTVVPMCKGHDASVLKVRNCLQISKLSSSIPILPVLCIKEQEYNLFLTNFLHQQRQKQSFKFCIYGLEISTKQLSKQSTFNLL